MKKNVFLIMIIVLLILPVSAFAKVGTTTAQFLKFGVSSRAVAMGEAFTAVSNDMSAVYYNPGGLIYVPGRALYGTHVDWPADINYDFVAYGQPLNSIGGSIGICFSALTMDDMERTDIWSGGSDGTTFGASSYMFGLTYARALTDRFSFGGTVKWIQEYLDDVSSSTPAADIGAYYNTGFRSLRIGFAITNFGPDAKFITEDAQIPINFHFGLAYDFLEAYPHNLVLALDGSHPNDNVERYDVGMEYAYNDMFFLRSGYQFEYDAQSYAFGGGAKIPLGFSTTALDYAYQDLDRLGNCHRISLTIEF